MTAELERIVSCALMLDISEETRLELQIAPAESAGTLANEQLSLAIDGKPLVPVDEIRAPHGGRIHLARVPRGRLSVDYRAELHSLIPGTAGASGMLADLHNGFEASSAYSEILYLRPSRYCPTDHLEGFANSEFGRGGDVFTRVNAILDWIHRRVEYQPGSGTVHDSAEHTLLTGVGSCRDFAHLGIALCRAIGVPARYTSVYAPGLAPMDFHAVFETFQNGRWLVHDPTGLAPRASMVRIATGRDAADTAFASSEANTATLVDMAVSAESDPLITVEARSEACELA